MIVEKGTLTGKISGIQDLTGTINKNTEIVFPETQEKQVTPTKQVQEIVPDSGIYALSKVTVNPIPNDYIIPNLQSKSITITENGTQTITADSGYNGLSSVGVTTNVSSGSSNDLYIELNQEGYGNYSGFLPHITKIKDIDLTEYRLSELFKNFYSLQEITIKAMPTSNNATSMFDCCYSLVTAPSMDTSNIQTWIKMFSGCTNLVNVPAYNISSCDTFGLSYAFKDCRSLSSESLNNILEMCINIPSTPFKTLARLGLTEEQATTCTGLSNYQAFLAAGWTTGY